MSWDRLIALLPKVMGSLPAIGAYCLLVLGGVSLFYRRQKSADWRRLLDSTDRNSPGAVAIAEAAGFEYGYGGNLPSKMKLRLRMRQLTVVIVFCVVGALTLIALAFMQARSDAIVKTTLLQQINKTSVALQSQLDLEQVNRAKFLGDLGVVEGQAQAAGSDNRTAADLAKELHELRDRFSSTVQQRYLSTQERNQLVIADAVLAIADGRIPAANQLLSRQFLDTLSAGIEVDINRALRANVLGIAARMGAKDYDGVIECARRILKFRPDNWFAIQQWAHALFLKGLFEEAVQKLGEVDVDSKPGGENWIFPAMVSGLRLNDPEETRKDLELSDKVNTSVNENAYGSSFRILPLIKSSDYPHSCGQSDRQEREQFARVWLAGDLIRQNRSEDAQILLNKAVEVCQDYRWALSVHAENSARLNLYDQAEKSLRRLAALGPLDAMHMMLLGVVQGSSGKHVEAEATFRKALQLNPDDPLIAIALANAKLGQGHLNDAINTLNSFLRRQWNTEVAITLTSAYGKAGLHRDVVKTASRILEKDPTNVNITYNKGMAFYKLHDYKNALDGFRQVLSLDKNAVDALYFGALSAADVGKFEEGLGYADRLIEVSPSYRECYFIRAQFLIRLNRFADAVSDLDKTKSRGEQLAYLSYFYYLSFKGLNDKKDAEIQCIALRQQKNIPGEIKALVPSECVEHAR